jgi:hypothetical protein
VEQKLLVNLLNGGFEKCNISSSVPPSLVQSTSCNQFIKDMRYV